MPDGTPVLAARDGVVEHVEGRYEGGPEVDPLTFYGNFIRVRHADGTAALYAHLRQAGVAVAPGAVVTAGQLVGYSGDTGEVERPMLHFGVTRPVRPGAPWETSIPVRFYVGVPPLVFEPRASMTVTARYAGEAIPPRFALDAWGSATWKPPTPTPESLRNGFAMLALLAVAGIAGMAWFWWISRH